MPLVPLWGVWADKYSRKAVIVRSALVEAVVFAGVALSREPWQLALSMLLIGFQLGNTGVMLAGIRDVTPIAPARHDHRDLRRLAGRSASPSGPALAGILIDGLGWSLPAVFWLSSARSPSGPRCWSRSARARSGPRSCPTGRSCRLAFGAVRGVLADPRRPAHLRDLRGVVPRHPDDPAVHPGARRGPRRHRARAGVGDRARRWAPRPWSAASSRRSGACSATGSGSGPCSSRALTARRLVARAHALSRRPSRRWPRSRSCLGAATATVSAMVFGLLATEVPAERRSATLNLVYLPLYAAGIVGPAIGAAVAATVGVPARSCSARRVLHRGDRDLASGRALASLTRRVPCRACRPSGCRAPSRARVDADPTDRRMR